MFNAWGPFFLDGVTPGPPPSAPATSSEQDSAREKQALRPLKILTTMRRVWQAGDPPGAFPEHRGALGLLRR
jgi:hypothetical protein